MKSVLILTLATLLLSACMTSTKKSDVAGVYQCTWFHSDTVLSLAADGSYLLDFTALQDEGIRGKREVGVWTRTGFEVVLHPTSTSYWSGFDDVRTLVFS